MAPAHVPQTGFVLQNWRRGSSRPASLASSAMVVDSWRYQQRAGRRTGDGCTSAGDDQGVTLCEIVWRADEDDGDLG